MLIIYPVFHKWSVAHVACCCWPIKAAIGYSVLEPKVCGTFRRYLMEDGIQMPELKVKEG
jgi:hypothetical protein